MENYYDDNQDLQFVLDHVVEWEKFIPLVEVGFADAKKYQQENDARFEYAPSTTEEAREIYKSIHRAYDEILQGELVPHLIELDEQGIKLEHGKVIVPEAQRKFIHALRNSGILNFSVSREFGGQNFGATARMPVNEMVSRADASTQIIVSYFNMAEMIEWFGDDDMKQKYLPLFAQGKMLGAMALTEPNYGSDLTQAQTKAVKKEDREFGLTGTKIFITQACGFDDAPAAIFTIARSLDKKGAFGLSFFLVETQDIEVSRLEEKIGLHTSATCEIRLDDSRGQLIGDEGAGLVRYAIQMMNGARLGIACQSLGIAQAAYSLAEKYASERIQFGKAINELPAVKRLLDESEAKVQACRALIYYSAQIVDTMEGHRFTLLARGEEERKARKHPDVAYNEKLAKVLTPLSKFTASEFCCQVAHDAVQVHGGVGYTNEYLVSKVYRDARITTIYEGTTQLQVVAIIGSIVEGVGSKSILSSHINDLLSELSDAPVREKIEGFWQKLAELVPLYKELEKPDRETVALDLVWHLAYTYCSLQLARHAEIARRESHSILENKQKVLNTFLRMAEKQIAGTEAYLKTFVGKAAATA